MNEFQLGCIDSCAWPTTFVVLYSSKRLRDKTFSVFAFSGFIYILSILIFDFIILPLSPLTYARSIEWFYYTCFVFPLCIACYVYSLRIYKEIASLSFQIFCDQNSKARGSKDKSVFNLIAVESFRGILLTLLFLQAYLTGFIPYIGPIFQFMQYCLLSSFYSFEYVWQDTQWSLEKRIEELESHFIYYLGFGFPFAFITFIIPHNAINQVYYN